jgi:radical SAM family uncharacterized protein/radical SAM-linked protein
VTARPKPADRTDRFGTPPLINLGSILEQQILPCVQRASRYLGTELNTVHKDPAEVDLRVALAFPDLYDLGLGNLGLLILYRILNELPWCWAERAYAPGLDMEKALRERGLPLFANESKDSLAAMDLVGFTLQSELTYTSVLNMLDLAGIPLRSRDRDGTHPLVCAGGPSAFNPEPVAPFMDFIVVGDGEEVVVEIATLLREMKGAPRRDKLEALSKVPGIYVPECYPFEELPDGRMVPREDAPKIARRLVRDLDHAPFPVDYIVPFTPQVHDRVSLEVLRGCTHGCRFCQAGMVTRPVRERSLDTIDTLMSAALANTGYEEVSLISLSTCDYSAAQALVRQAAKRASEQDVSVSLPSLRLETFAVELADMVAGVRRTGLTVAPEAASPRLRAVINKWIPDEELLRIAEEAYKHGWNHVKTYFMIGLPTETDDDVAAIVNLCVRALDRGRAVNPKARVNTGVSTFVPKPFTPFQWAEQIGLEESYRRQRLLQEGFHKHSSIKFGRHDPRATLIEGMITRGDRRTADLLEAAWRHGARLDSWDEHLNWRAWQEAIEETGFDVADALRAREPEERLPWDHIDVLIPKQWFQDDWERAKALQHVPDCRQGTCNACGVTAHENDLCRAMIERSASGHGDEKAPPPPLERPAEPAPAQRLRFRIGRTGLARFLSNRELINVWIRALRRAGVPLAYSQGFHAHPKVQFACAPPVGEETVDDVMDVVLRETVAPEAVLARLQARLPQGIDAFDAREVPLKSPSLMSAATGFLYEVTAPGDAEAVSVQIQALLAASEIRVEKPEKPKTGRRRARRATEVDIRPMIAAIRLRQSEGNQVTVDVETRVIEGRFAQMRHVVPLLGLDPERAKVVKRATCLADE